MLIHTPRFLLRDFAEADRAAFLSYQADPRYRRLYDLGAEHSAEASMLFSRFLAWQAEQPRRNHQLGIFDRAGRLCGCAGLRGAEAARREAELGIELAPSDWGRYRLALEVAAALIDFGFERLGLERIVGRTASGNRRVERLARWFGAELVARHAAPGWMAARGWIEVEWALTRARWAARPGFSRP